MPSSVHLHDHLEQMSLYVGYNHQYDNISVRSLVKQSLLVYHNFTTLLKIHRAFVGLYFTAITN
jgi:hypothetical protein